MTKTLIAPSLLSCDFGRVAEEARAVQDAGADWLHMDVMDGRFVPNITFGPEIVAAVRRSVTIPIDAHLMIVEPEKHIDAFLDAGVDLLVFHVEATAHVHRLLGAIKEGGAKRGRTVQAGVAINPHTPVSSFAPAIDLVDFALVMTVNPGWGGQSFIASALEKVRELAKLGEQKQPELLIGVDGGVCAETAQAVVQAGARFLVAGSAVFKAPDYAQAIRAIRQAGSRTKNAS